MTATLIDPVDELTRRRLLTGAGMLGILSVLPASAWGQETGGPAEPGAFPVTVEHKYGGTEITKEPKRVVTLGYTDHDPALALGVRPVGLVNWYGDYPFGVWPWAQDALGGAEPQVIQRAAIDDGVPYERIAAMEPDLIIGLYTGLTEQDYSLLSRIASTVAQSGEFGDFEMPWQEMTRVMSQALGRPERAERLIAGVDERFAEARAAHPELQGATVILTDRFEAGKSYLRGTAEPRVRVLTDLGLVIPDQVAAVAGEGGADLSDERMDLLEADVLVWTFLEAGELGDNPIYKRLPVAREGRAVVLDEIVGGALAWGTVLSLPFALDRLVPLLAAAVDGDPATAVRS